jgi:hypothetical protein
MENWKQGFIHQKETFNYYTFDDKMKTKTTIIGVVLLLAGCTMHAFFREELPQLTGVAEKQLVSKYGVPESVRTNTVASFTKQIDGPNELSRRVLAAHPTNDETNLSIPIRSLSWTKGRIQITAWLQEQTGIWVVLYGERWNMDVME